MSLDGVRQDLRSGVRGLRRAPGFAAAALVTLALGIGATSAIFTVVKAVLLTPLPYAQPETRVLVWSRWISFDKTWLSAPEILDYRRLTRTLTAVAGWTTAQQSLTGDGEPVRVNAGLVTANTFAVLGAAPLLGRTITPAEDRPQAAPVAVLGYGLWQGRYGGDPSVVGRRIALDDVPVEIVGVMPRGLPPAHRLLCRRGRADAALARRCSSTSVRPSAGRTATSRRRCWRRGRRRPPLPRSCAP